jgi:hypothetical protein
MTFTPRPVAPKYPVTPSDWCQFYNQVKVMVVPHFNSARLHFLRISRAELVSPRNAQFEYAPNFFGETVNMIVTTTSGKQIGVVYCNGLPELSKVVHPILQVDMNNAVSNQRWVKPS